MASTPEQCVNYEINRQQCPCESTDCENWAICCECMNAHAQKDGQTMCMRDTERPAETRPLPIGRNADCTNRARNEEICVCGETSCSRRALCCDCVRYHWGHRTWPRTACMG